MNKAGRAALSHSYKKFVRNIWAQLYVQKSIKYHTSSNFRAFFKRLALEASTLLNIYKSNAKYIGILKASCQYRFYSKQGGGGGEFYKH